LTAGYDAGRAPPTPLSYAPNSVGVAFGLGAAPLGLAGAELALALRYRRLVGAVAVVEGVLNAARSSHQHPTSGEFDLDRATVLVGGGARLGVGARTLLTLIGAVGGGPVMRRAGRAVSGDAFASTPTAGPRGRRWGRWALPFRSEVAEPAGPQKGRLSTPLRPGIPKGMSSRREQRWWWLCVTVALLVSAQGCGWRDLHHDELFGPSDAEAPIVDGGTDTDASPPLDATPDNQSDDQPGDLPATVDASVDQVDVDPGPDAPVVCTPASCGAGHFCDDLTQRCQPNSGVGRLSGIVIDACDHHALQARVGIAGQHQCAVEQKGAYYFQSNLPLGNLTLAAYAEGYKLFSTPVVITAGGTTQNIVMERDASSACDGPPPPAAACTCVISGCPGVP
jgi:hypothetical protein